MEDILVHFILVLPTKFCIPSKFEKENIYLMKSKEEEESFIYVCIFDFSFKD